ncbi:hypothetical protein A1Q2_05243 [Trichosporon asahii var. asahii CBS 8904]|uniref:Uncharacterized protein n=1 Tax=Trichosporon asahii var. asahii (strain CBS 8904) TaxID=1220162 RepID=K1VHS0_TRIAC|nr:hypothetical protein A1Q2_05243 [Trichosporon asahii var. asahii CBS 8904]
MSISLRLARRSVAGFGIRSSSPRLLSTLYTPRRPGLSLPSSISAASPNVFLTQRRNISDGGSGAASAASEAAASAASAAPQATASTADIVSNLGTSPFFETVWQAAKSIVLFPTNMVTEALVNIPTPSYVLSVFVLAYVLRTTLTFPMQIWQRKRVERLHRFVHPHLDGINERIALETMVEAKRDGWPYEKYIETVRKKMADAVFIMHKTHRTHPWVTMLAPAAVNIPLLIAASFGVRNALLASPEIATSSSLWLQSLGDPDSTAILPIATAILAYGNIELIQRSQRIRKKLHKLADVAPKEKLDQVEKLEPMPDAPDHLKPRPGPTPEAASDHMLELGPAKENLGQSGQLRPGIARARASSRLEKPRSQIVDETRLKPGSPPFRPLEPPKPVPKGERRKPRAPPKLENVSKVNRVLEFALSDRDRMSKGFGNFMSVVAICIVPAGMMTPALVVSYWFASMSYTALQTVAFTHIDKKKYDEIRSLLEIDAQKSLQGKLKQQAELDAALAQAPGRGSQAPRLKQ